MGDQTQQACTWPTCRCTAKGQFCQGAVRVTLQPALPPANDAVQALVGGYAIKNPFEVRHKHGLLEVWEGEPDSFEGEFVLCIDPSFVPSLIAALTEGDTTNG